MESLIENLLTHWNLSVTPKSILAVLWRSLVNIRKAVKNRSLLMHTSAEVKHGGTLPSPFSSPTINKRPFYGLFSATIFTCLCFLLISLFKMAPKHSAKNLSVGLKGKTLWCSLQKKICVLDELHSGMSYSAFGLEFNVMIQQYILDKASLYRSIHKTRLCIDQLMKMLWPKDQKPNPMCLLRATVFSIH